jgi:opacity protein-like surface antigen
VFFIGGGFKYLNFAHALSGTFVNALTADIAVLLTPGLGLSFAAVGYNVIPITTNEAPLSMAVAGSWNIQGLTLAFDWLLDYESSWPPGMTFLGGAEYYLMDMIPLRIGYQNDQVRKLSAVTFGAGFSLGIFALDVAYMQGLERLDDRTFSVGIKFYAFTPPAPSAVPGSMNSMMGGIPQTPQAYSITE